MPACRTFPLPPSRSSEKLTRLWQARALQTWLLWPIGACFQLLSTLRRSAYRAGLLRSERLPVPVIVVGNIVAGGAGKTPLTLWLAQRLRASGRCPGIVSRGYGRTDSVVRIVGAGETAGDVDAVAAVGDEPLLLARRSGCPVVVGSDRVAAGRALLAAHPDCDMILCDDGLQHYRLHRDVEIAVIDRRGLMNGWPLPAGPLREPAARLHTVDAVVLHDSTLQLPLSVPTFHMRLHGKHFYRLDAPDIRTTPGELARLRLHAIAGIGEPQRFFDHLSALGLAFEVHAFPDHYRYTESDLQLVGDAILTTEKDALKCTGLTTLPIWVLPVDAVIEPDLAAFILERINGPAPA